MVRPAHLVVASILVVTAACSADDSVESDATASAPPSGVSAPAATETLTPATTATTTTGDTAAPATSAATTSTERSTPPVQPSSSIAKTADAVPGDDVPTMIEVLASDAMAGRDNLTPGSELARNYIVGQLERFAEPGYLRTAGAETFLQTFDLGTNVIAWLPGGDLPDEYVMIGGHYDHVGSNCREVSTADAICNGATDNAAGVAAAIEVARSILAEGVPRRSVIIALWDAEEDGLLGSRHYVNDPAFPLEQLVAYINLDIQGSDLVPSLANTTIAIGAETGGPQLVDAVGASAEVSTLDTLMLSLEFGQGRSDHAAFVAAGVPSVFLTDGPNGCYHTVVDVAAGVRLDKLDQQIASATALVRTLASDDEIPVLQPAPEKITFGDAVQLHALAVAAEPDLALLGAPGRAAIERYIVDLGAIVEEGAASFDDSARTLLLGGAATLLTAFTESECGLSTASEIS
ncbi:MAG: M20/M25/M40 family metallo-hydrolase [Acidimicrobiia bacterium]|nr:M20/M25/M40 family metallo-hydrolase [Acidimicrobiia bacterium]